MITLLWLLVILSIGSAGLAGLSAAPWLPTRKKELKLLTSAVTKFNLKNVYDLGCGDGRILFALAPLMPSTRFTGLEISFLPYLAAIIRKTLGGKKYHNVKIIFQSLFKHDLSQADGIISFLLGDCYDKLSKKFIKELKPDTLIFIEAWPLKNITIKETFTAEKTLPFYIYEAGALNK